MVNDRIWSNPLGYNIVFLNRFRNKEKSLPFWKHKTYKDFQSEFCSAGRLTMKQRACLGQYYYCKKSKGISIVHIKDLLAIDVDYPKLKFRVEIWKTQRSYLLFLLTNPFFFFNHQEN